MRVTLKNTLSFDLPVPRGTLEMRWSLILRFSTYCSFQPEILTSGLPVSVLDGSNQCYFSLATHNLQLTETFNPSKEGFLTTEIETNRKPSN